MVRCKFKCESVKDGRVILRAVTSGGSENDEFFKWTPNGLLDLSTVNEPALAQFTVSAEYYIDIHLAD